jgi:ornithine carbamoyltransferase
VKQKHLLSLKDFSAPELEEFFALAAKMKADPAAHAQALARRTLAMVFQKPSTRTRVSFEVGMFQLGGHALFLGADQIQLQRGETLADTAKVLSGYVDGIVARVFSQQDVVDLARHGSVPVINGLSDQLHPCQALTDFFTLKELKGNLQGLKLAYVGDGNNVAHSLLLTAAATGGKMTVATPAGYEPLPEVVAQARAIAQHTGAVIKTTHDPEAAVAGADAIYTDVWASMGQEAESEQRKQIFAPYQVNKKLMAHAAKHAIFMHCLPAHRGDEVTDAVIDSPRSAVFDQAENRMHAQKAVMLILLGGGAARFPRRNGHA